MILGMENGGEVVRVLILVISPVTSRTQHYPTHLRRLFRPGRNGYRHSQLHIRILARLRPKAAQRASLRSIRRRRLVIFGCRRLNRGDPRRLLPKLVRVFIPLLLHLRNNARPPSAHLLRTSSSPHLLTPHLLPTRYRRLLLRTGPIRIPQLTLTLILTVYLQLTTILLTTYHHHIRIWPWTPILQ